MVSDAEVFGRASDSCRLRQLTYALPFSSLDSIYKAALLAIVSWLEWRASGIAVSQCVNVSRRNDTFGQFLP